MPELDDPGGRHAPIQTAIVARGGAQRRCSVRIRQDQIAWLELKRSGKTGIEGQAA